MRNDYKASEVPLDTTWLVQKDCRVESAITSQIQVEKQSSVKQKQTLVKQVHS